MATPNIADQSGQNTTPEKTYTISELLESFPTLSYRIHVFVFDLRSFREKSDVQESSQARLNESLDLLYLSAPYFTPEEVHAMKHTLVGARALETFVQESLDERLERRAKKRQDSKDFRICCAHDLAPVYEEAFNIDRKLLAKDKEFLQLVKEKGLELPEDVKWTGLSNKRHAQNAPNQRRRRGRR